MSGNLSFKKFSVVESNAVFLTNTLLSQILPKLEALQDDGNAESLSVRVQAFWKNKDLEYNADEVRLRYSTSNRDELGGVLASLFESGRQGILTETVGRALMLQR